MNQKNFENSSNSIDKTLSEDYNGHMKRSESAYMQEKDKGKQDKNKQKTIYDISSRAGVSIATVSRVMNGSPKVSAKTKERVLQVIEECGYEPNAFARGLGTGSMRTIGILCAGCGRPLSGQRGLLSGTRTAAERIRYDPELHGL